MFDSKLGKKFINYISELSNEVIYERAERAHQTRILSTCTNSKIIFLDDERDIEDVTWINYPSHDFVATVRTFDEWKYIIPYVKDWDNTYFSLDHDIQDFDDDGNEYTGYSCLKWLCEYILDNKIDIKHLNILIHTKNPVGRENIECYHRNFMCFLKEKK